MNIIKLIILINIFIFSIKFFKNLKFKKALLTVEIKTQIKKLIDKEKVYLNNILSSLNAEQINSMIISTSDFTKYSHSLLSKFKDYFKNVSVSDLYEYICDTILNISSKVHENKSEFLPLIKIIYPNCSPNKKNDVRKTFSQFDIKFFQKDFTPQELSFWGEKLINKNKKIALKFLEISAKKRDYISPYILGKYYLSENKIELSEKWFKKAAHMKNSDAMLKLSLIYKELNKTKKFKKWLIKSSNLGNKEAISKVNLYAEENVLTLNDIKKYS